MLVHTIEIENETLYEEVIKNLEDFLDYIYAEHFNKVNGLKAELRILDGIYAEYLKRV